MDEINKNFINQIVVTGTVPEEKYDRVERKVVTVYEERITDIRETEEIVTIAFREIRKGYLIPCPLCSGSIIQSKDCQLCIGKKYLPEQDYFTQKSVKGCSCGCSTDDKSWDSKFETDEKGNLDYHKVKQNKTLLYTYGSFNNGGPFKEHENIRHIAHDNGYPVRIYKAMSLLSRFGLLTSWSGSTYDTIQVVRDVQYIVDQYRKDFKYPLSSTFKRRYEIK